MIVDPRKLKDIAEVEFKSGIGLERIIRFCIEILKKRVARVIL